MAFCCCLGAEGLGDRVAEAEKGKRERGAHPSSFVAPCPTLWSLARVSGVSLATPKCPIALMGSSTDGIPSALSLQQSLQSFLPSGSLSPWGHS